MCKMCMLWALYGCGFRNMNEHIRWKKGSQTAVHVSKICEPMWAHLVGKAEGKAEEKDSLELDL